GVARQLALAPIAARPHRVGHVAALELDPHARAGLGQESKADIGARIGHAGHAPAGFAVAEHRRHLGLDTQRVRVDCRHGAAILAVEPVAHAVEKLGHQGLVDDRHGSPPSRPPPPVGAGPTALRTSTKRILCASAVKLWRTLQTKYLPEFRLPAPSICTT